MARSRGQLPGEQDVAFELSIATNDLQDVEQFDEHFLGSICVVASTVATLYVHYSHHLLTILLG